jgi:hypothetical protein
MRFSGDERPIVRGSLREYEDDYQGRQCTVRCDGRIELRWKRFWSEPGENKIDIRWILAASANVMLMSEAFASAAGIPGSEYAIEVEAISYSSSGFGSFSLYGWDWIESVVGRIETPFVQRLAVTDKDQVLSILLTDLRDAADVRSEKAATISVEWPNSQ